MQTITQYETYIYINPAHIGFILGKKGHTIKGIASQTKCFLQLNNDKINTNKDVGILIKSTSLDNLDKGCERLKKVISIAHEKIPVSDSNITNACNLDTTCESSSCDDHFHTTCEPDSIEGGNESIEGDSLNVYTPLGLKVTKLIEYKTFVYAHPDHLSYIIGKGGETIKNIGRETSTFLKIDNNNTNELGHVGFQVKGPNKVDVKEACSKFYNLANIANSKIPRIKVHNPNYSEKSFASKLEQKMTLSDFVNF